MVNPILQRLNQRNAQPQMNNILNLVQMLKTGNPQVMFNNMMQSNPQFAQFINDNQGMTPEQIASKYGVDIGAIKSLMRQ